jgi:uncharacterized membrane protein
VKGRVRLLGFAIHPMLVVFPLALLTTGVAFDVLHRLRESGLGDDRGYTGFWAVFAYWLMATGVVGGLAAAPFGVLDWLSLPAKSRAKALGRWHGLGNALVLALFAASWLLRRDDPEEPGTVAFALALTGLGLVALTAWLGLEMVGRLGGAAEPALGLDAPGSLLDFVFERHPVYAGQRVKEVWANLTGEAAAAQVEFARLAGEAEEGGPGARAAVAERLEGLGERWAPFAGATWASQPPRQVAAARILWEYFREQHPGGTAQMYDVWLADSELRRRGAPGFPRRAAATCGLLMALSALWGCGLVTVLMALLD